MTGVRIIKRLFFWMGITLFILFTWKLFIAECTRPVEQRTEDGYFEGMDSQIRDIRLCVETKYRETVAEESEFTVWIIDENGERIWEETFHDMSLKDGELLILGEYERGEGIDIGTGRYQICDTLARDDNIRINYRVFFYNGDYRDFYLICAAVALIFLALVLVMTMRPNQSYQLAINYFLALVMMGILFSIIMPPLTVPDEESHFRMAYDLSSTMMFQSKELMRKTDNDSITYLHNAASISRWYASFNEPTDGTEVVSTKWTSVSSTTPSYAYIFSAVGISLARLCGLNGHWAILLGRLFNLFGVSALMAVSLHLIPFGKKYFCVLGLLPETVYIVASYSYDGLNIALCFLAVSYFFYMISEERKVKASNLIIFFGIVLVMIPVKLVYAPLIGLPLLIPKEQLDINRKLLLGTVMAGVLGGFVLLLLRWEDIVVLLRGLPYNMEGESRVSIKFILENPKSTIFVFVNNMMCNLDYYIKSIAGEFVGRDRRGVLLDIAYLPEWIMVMLGILLAMGIHTDKRIGLQLWKKVWLAVLGMTSCFLILLSMYLANNSIEKTTIHGVQGRYFLPVLLLLPALFGKRKNGSMEEGVELSRNSYLIISTGICIIAIFVQLQHLAMDYYG